MDRNRGLDINALRRQLEDLFEDFFPASGARHAGGGRGGDQTQSLPLNLAETEDAFTLSAPLPGFQPEDVDITVRGQNVSIRAQHKASADADNLARREWGQISFQRSFELPSAVEAEQASAAFRHGVVTVTLPKAAPATVVPVEADEPEAREEAVAEPVPEAAAAEPEAPASGDKEKGSFYMAPGRGRRGRRHAGAKSAEPSEAAMPEAARAEEQSAGTAEAASAEPGDQSAISENAAREQDRDEQSGFTETEAAHDAEPRIVEEEVAAFAEESEQAAEPPTD
jgi:HSP20 family protein